MSRLTELIRQAKDRDPALGAELEREYRALAGRRAFGLNFERHRPEAVELHGRPPRLGDKVRVLPPRGSGDRDDQKLWRVARIERTESECFAHLDPLGNDDRPPTVSPLDDLVVVAEFRDPIYPGLLSTGSVYRGGDKPAHTVINGENFHVLKALTYTHRGRVDAIYIDPPYNTGAKDWKYNNDYVEADDLYRHSKWLAFMERRLLLAGELLNPSDSVLVVTIDEKEYLRLGLLLEQVFPDADIQMVTTVISPQGVARPGSFSRVNEFVFVARFGACKVQRTGDDMLIDAKAAVDAPVWFSLIRSGTNARRQDSKNGFYPVFVDPESRRVAAVGEPLPPESDRSDVADRPGLETLWPIRRDGSEGNWQLTPPSFLTSLESGFIKVGERNPAGNWALMYVRAGDRQRLDAGDVIDKGRDEWGNRIFERIGSSTSSRIPKSVWNRLSHDAGKQGSMLLARVLGGRKFPFPKSLYAVEDVLRFFVIGKPNAVILDFFAGSGTTAHAVMRLNRQDAGRRQCISVTNNEVSADEHRRLTKAGLRPGDPEWDALGICDYITKPRLAAAITGQTPDGEPIRGDYKFTDEFPIAEGFEENAEFFTLTYESPIAVGHNRAFERVAPLLWLRAGAEGRVIDAVPAGGWETADTYGVLWDLDRAGDFARAVATEEHIGLAYVVTDDDRRFQSVARQLPKGVEVVRLYESYLANFRFTGSEP